MFVIQQIVTMPIHGHKVIVISHPYPAFRRIIAKQRTCFGSWLKERGMSHMYVTCRALFVPAHD